MRIRDSGCVGRMIVSDEDIHTPIAIDIGDHRTVALVPLPGGILLAQQRKCAVPARGAHIERHVRVWSHAVSSGAVNPGNHDVLFAVAIDIAAEPLTASVPRPGSVLVLKINSALSIAAC